MNLFIRLEQKKVETHKKVCENKDFCGVVMSSEDINILEFNQYRIFDKTQSIVYADLEFLIKIDGCKNNPEKGSLANIGEHIPCEYSMSTLWIFDGLENKHDVYRSEDCMKTFCDSLREHAVKIINFEKRN